MPPTVHLVDASTFIHRSFHAIRNLSTRDGRPTNAVFGFVATLNKLLKEQKPTHLAVVYDAKGPSFRAGMYPEYKANRPPMPQELIDQQDPIRRIVAAMGLAGIETPGLEADDIVATLTRKALEQGFDVVIVSGDKDFFQLLSDRVTMYDPNPKRESVLNTAGLMEKLSLSPDGFLQAQGLMGDSTDNIPGVPGVGEKTAAKLIQEFGNLETLYDRLDQVASEKLRARLAEHKASAFLSRDLARLKADAELGRTIEDLKVGPGRTEELADLYRDLEFTKFASDIKPLTRISYDDYHLVTTEAELDGLIAELAQARRLSVDLETTSIDPLRADVVGLSFCARPGRAFYVPVGHQTLGARQLEWPLVSERLKGWLEDPRLPKIGQNLKYDALVLRRQGIHLNPIADDSMLVSYLLDPGAVGHNLDDLSRKHLGHPTILYQDVVGHKNAGFETVSPEAAREYACEDADVALRLVDELKPRLEETGLLRLYEDVEMPLVDVLVDMEYAGVGLDLGLLAELSKDFQFLMDQAQDRIFGLAGRQFNLNSPKQLGEVLFEGLGLPQGKKTKKKSGYSTDVEVLTDLAALHPLPAEVLNYRTLTKLRSTYVEALTGLVHPETGRVHTSFNQAVTATGRLSSSDPNLQNIPIRTPEGRRIRQAFVAAPGHRILSADYSQVELRVLAHCSGDPGLIEAFRNREDVHTRTASEVFGVMPALVDSAMRREAKAINFGIVYGLGAFGLAKQLGIDKKMAQKYIDQYFQRYSGVRIFIDETLAQARKTGYVTTLLGRRRALPDLNHANHNIRAMAERMAVNTPIQGTAADLIKLAMLAVHRAIGEQGLKARMILQVHDELVFEAPEDELESMTALVKTNMEGVMELKVPLVVDTAYGPSWAEAH